MINAENLNYIYGDGVLYGYKLNELQPIPQSLEFRGSIKLQVEFINNLLKKYRSDVGDEKIDKFLTRIDNGKLGSIFLPVID